MKLQRFIDALDQKGIEASDFFEKNGKDIFQNTKLLTALLDLKWGEETHLKLVRIAWIIASEFRNREYEKKRNFDILPIYEHFQEYMSNDCSLRGVSFEYWEGIQKEYIDLLKILIQEGKLNEDFEKDLRVIKFRRDAYDRFLKIRFKSTKDSVEKGDDHNTVQYELARMYHEGEGVQKDYKKALYWYKKSAEQGNIYAQNNLATMYALGVQGKTGYKKAFYWYSKSAEGGDVLAQVSLGKLYLEGLGCSKNYKKALYWYEKAVEKKSGDAECELGKMYEQGLGVSQDRKKAFELYERAAYKNCVSAQERLSDAYFEGIGKPQDYKKAYIWMDLVCRNRLKEDMDVLKRRKKISKYLSSLDLKEVKKKAGEMYKSIINSILFGYGDDDIHYG